MSVILSDLTTMSYLILAMGIASLFLAPIMGIVAAKRGSPALLHLLVPLGLLAPGLISTRNSTSAYAAAIERVSSELVPILRQSSLWMSSMDIAIAALFAGAYLAVTGAVLASKSRGGADHPDDSRLAQAGVLGAGGLGLLAWCAMLISQIITAQAIASSIPADFVSTTALNVTAVALAIIAVAALVAGISASGRQRIEKPEGPARTWGTLLAATATLLFGSILAVTAMLAKLG